MTETIAFAHIEELLKHRQWLRRLAHHLVHEDAVDDILQDTCVRALSHGVPSDRPARPWLATVMRNVVRMNRRGSQRRTRREENSHSTTPDPWSAEELVDRVRLERQLAQLVTDLDEPFRTTLLLRYYEGLSSAEIGRNQGVAAATVRWRLRQGLERVRKILDTEHGGERTAWHAVFLPITLPSLGPTAGASMMTELVAPVSKGISGVSGGLLVAAGITTVAATGWSLAVDERGNKGSSTPSSLAVAGATPEARQPTSKIRAIDPGSPEPPSAVRRIDAATRADLRARILGRRSGALAAHSPPSSSPRARPDGGPHEVIGADSPSSSGAIDKEYIRQQMQEIIPVFQECYQLSLAEHPGLEGKIVLDFTIIGEPEVGGLVESCEHDVEQSTIVDPELLECVRESVYTLEFPPPERGGTVTVTYPILFEDHPE